MSSKADTTMRSHAGFMNDGSSDPPKLQIFLNLDNLEDLRPGSVWGGEQGPQRYKRLAADGFDGVQFTSNDPVARNEAALPYCGLDRINSAAEAEDIVARHVSLGDACLTVHAGWGLEDDDEAFRLAEAVLAASERHQLPVFIETHRATMTQDLWRTVNITRHVSAVRFNGDFSHYYCGQELVYGDWERKMAFMEPIFDRIGFLHGRIANPGCMQVSIDSDGSSRPRQAHGDVNYLTHFKELWVRAMCGFFNHAQRGDVLLFTPELLPSRHYYARMFPGPSGELVEESDRYAEALLYRDLARHCFREAQDSQSILTESRAK